MMKRFKPVCRISKWVLISIRKSLGSIRNHSLPLSHHRKSLYFKRHNLFHINHQNMLIQSTSIGIWNFWNKITNAHKRLWNRALLYKMETWDVIFGLSKTFFDRWLWPDDFCFENVPNKRLRMRLALKKVRIMVFSEFTTYSWILL